MQSDDLSDGLTQTIDEQTLEQKLQSSQSIGQNEAQQLFNEQLQSLANDEPIFITVGNPSEVKSSQLNKHLVYVVRGRDALGQFEVQRRFNEFYTLRECLLNTWPGLYVPPIPEKQINPTGEQLLERIRLLNIFVMKMAQIKYLYYSEEFVNVFLRSTQTDVCKQLQNLPKPNVKSQIDKYKHLFEVDFVQEPDIASLNKISLMQKFCKTQQSSLVKYLDQAKNLSASKRILKDLFHSIFGSSLFEYESLILKPCLESEKQLVFCNPTATELKSTLDYLKDQQNFSVDRIQDLITTEQRDLEAFLEAFSTREQLLHFKTKVESKLREQQEKLTQVMTGKSSVKNQEETRLKLEMAIIESQNEVDQYKYYYQIVTHVLITKAIDKFKRDKHEAYKKIIKDLATKEIESNQVMQEVWARIMSLAESLKTSE